MSFNDLWNSAERLGSLNTLANWGIAATLLIAFACTVIAVKTSSRKDELTRAENLRKAEHIADLDHANLTLRGQVATLETNAASANKDVAGLQKAAADAKAAQQRVEIDLAKQQERAANAERDAAEAKLELEDFRTPRYIHDSQGFIAEMKVFSGQKFSCAVANDQEAFAFLFELQMTLESSGWVPIPPRVGPPFVDVTGGMRSATGAGGAGVENGIGVYVEYPHALSNESVRRARALVSALNKQGISAQEATRAIAPDTLNILVGEKPGRWKWPNVPAKHQ
jgi:hypothetical protein